MTVDSLSARTRVAIVIPVYNAESYLVRCLNSILAQTYQNWVAICVDDGSTDRSLEILRQYQQKDARIVVLAQANQGVSAARNVALDYLYRQCQDRFDAICFVDSDDYATPDMLSIYTSIYEQKAVDLVSVAFHSDSFCFDAKKRRFDEGYLTGADWLRMIYRVNRFRRNQCAGGYSFRNFYSKRLLTDVRFPQNRDICEDEYFNFEVALKDPKIYRLNKCVYIYCDNASSLSKDSGFSYALIKGRELALLRLIELGPEKRNKLYTQYLSIVLAGFIRLFIELWRKRKAYKELSTVDRIPNLVHVMKLMTFNHELPKRNLFVFLIYSLILKAQRS